MQQTPKQPSKRPSSKKDQQISLDEPSVEQKGSIRVPELDPTDIHDFGVPFHPLLQAVLPPDEYKKWQEIEQVNLYFENDHLSDPVQGTFPPLQISCNHNDNNPECICRPICLNCSYRMDMTIMQNYSRAQEELPQGVLNSGYGVIPTFPAYTCQRVNNKFNKNSGR